MKLLKKVLLWIWQFPQNILGLLVISITWAKKEDGYFMTSYADNFNISLGNYIVLGKYIYSKTLLAHKQGHQKQSQYFGPLYLIIIGLPVVFEKLYDKIFHNKWTGYERVKWYYNQPCEKWADKIKKVNRQSNKALLI